MMLTDVSLQTSDYFLCDFRNHVVSLLPPEYDIALGSCDMVQREVVLSTQWLKWHF